MGGVGDFSGNVAEFIDLLVKVKETVQNFCYTNYCDYSNY